jgi:hypothetical protein
MQTFTVQLDRREQETLSRRLLVNFLKKCGAVVPRLRVACVGGNHGEHRKDGKSFTTFGDNSDVALFEQVAEILAESPLNERIEWFIPKNELAITVDIGSAILGLAHGHQTGQGATAQAKVKEWWKKMAFANDGLADVDYLNTAHYHHFSVVQYGKRYHIQAPAMNSASSWFEHIGGDRQTPGMLTYCIRDDGSFFGMEIL